jgi:hypothetical protein
MACLSNINFESFKIFILLLFLMLDGGGCLNALLIFDLFSMNLAHFLWDQYLESF